MRTKRELLIRIILICDVSRETFNCVIYIQHFVIYLPYYSIVARIRHVLRQIVAPIIVAKIRHNVL